MQQVQNAAHCGEQRNAHAAGQWPAGLAEVAEAEQQIAPAYKGKTKANTPTQQEQIVHSNVEHHC
jgi:hypothetical protein